MGDECKPTALFCARLGIMSELHTDWRECQACGATVRHDNGFCIRDPRHHAFNRITRSGKKAGPQLGTGLRPDLAHSQPHPGRV